jgi:hypothetical protein
VTEFISQFAARQANAAADAVPWQSSREAIKPPYT